ncbi:DUF6225 family protein [Paractinoplanes tereljensis]|uniref:DUF6225 family protein n=1 Tax=Paractinoplanes tereljensis TaxID=571912 RepID=UPI003392891B
MTEHHHRVDQWTVGRLRAALQQLPDDTVLRAEVADSPSTWPGSDPWGNDQPISALNGRRWYPPES